MKKALAIIIISLGLLISCSQNENRGLINDMQNYIKANNEHDFKNLVEFYPEFYFDSISKKEVISGLQNFYSEESKNKILLDSNFKIDTIIFNNSQYYARIQNKQNFTMDLTEFEDENGMDYAVSMAYGLFVNQYGKDNVKYEKEKWIFHIKSEKPVYGIKNKDENWKFFELNEITKKHLPIEIISSGNN